MNRRLLSSFVSLLYVSVALVFGVIHHHHENANATGHVDDCAACQWQINAASDAPVVVVPTAVPVTICFAEVPAFVPVTPESPFFSSTASRAPPAAPA